MKLELDIVRLFFLILPGIIYFRIYTLLQGKGERDNWEKLAEVLLMSLISYIEVLLFILTLKFFGVKKSFDVYEFLIGKIQNMPFLEIFVGIVCSILNACVFSVIIRKNIFYEIANKWRITDRFADRDIWDIINKDVRGWIIIHDHKLGLSYHGWVEYFSEHDKKYRELSIRKAKVVETKTDITIAERELIYVFRKRTDIDILIPLNKL